MLLLLISRSIHLRFKIFLQFRYNLSPPVIFSAQQTKVKFFICKAFFYYHYSTMFIFSRRNFHTISSQFTRNRVGYSSNMVLFSSNRVRYSSNRVRRATAATWQTRCEPDLKSSGWYLLSDRTSLDLLGIVPTVPGMGAAESVGLSPSLYAAPLKMNGVLPLVPGVAPDDTSSAPCLSMKEERFV